MLGILLTDKPRGLSSHDVVNTIRRRFGTRRVGHAGTLDPLATGLLVVAVGPATRFLQYLPLEPKEYIAEITFGTATTTYDAEGEVEHESPPPADLEGEVGSALEQFSGLIQQIPPMFSAVKVEGKPLYKYARQGLEAKREPRTVHIGAFELKELSETTGRFRIECSGGTYVRSLAHDLGQAVGCGAYLSKLERTRVGRFMLSEATPLEDVKPQHLLPLREALKPMPMVQLDEVHTKQVREGRSVGAAEPPDSNYAALLDPTGVVFSVARVRGNLLMPDCVIPAEAPDGIA